MWHAPQEELLLLAGTHLTVPHGTGNAGSDREYGSVEILRSTANRPTRGKDSQSQQAIDRAHNEAILAGTDMGDEQSARQLSTRESKVKCRPHFREA
jgi:hypothetical protein